MTKKLDITLFPSSLNGEISSPPSKSLSHRALICASLSKGKSTINNVVFSEDILATINALELLGANFEKHTSSLVISGIRKIKAPLKVIDCNESGSTLRFLIPLFSLSDKKISFTGKKSLILRPQSIYQEIFKRDKNTFEIHDNKIVVKGSIKARSYLLKGNVSSQFFSGLMFALPLLNEDSTIYIDGALESKSYIDLTIDTLEKYGVKIIELENGYYIPGNQSYIPHDYTVEGDYSQAAFHLVGGVISDLVKVSDLQHDSKQGDIAIIDFLKQMNSKVIYMENGYLTSSSHTQGTVIDLSDCPDLGPIITLLACLSEGESKIINISRLRLKESDRVESTVSTLKSLGAKIKSTENEIIIEGISSFKGGVTVDSFNDHRIAMMLSIAALRCDKEIILTNANVVSKSYPTFFKDYKSLGGKFETIKD
ncbi:MAG: 3-phosphoshikimate 1-carboxyvinyltransferase [Candidatus Izimaplasma sp.]|nr:3-phosphoshikimate 1-carboxyvinyltransferase [Candidatus Izimaplasma bacterium]